MTVDHSKIGRNSKAKGNRFERHIAKLLTEYTKVNFRRTPASGGFNKGGTVIAGHIFCGDLMCDDPNFKYSIEAKNRKNFSFESIMKNVDSSPFTEWWFQAVRDADKYSLHPLLFFKSKQADFVAVPQISHDELSDFGIVARQYSKNVAFSMIERAPGSNKKLKHNIVAKLPIPVIMAWESWQEKVNPTIMFSKPSNLDSKCLILEYK